MESGKKPDRLPAKRVGIDDLVAVLSDAARILSGVAGLPGVPVAVRVEVGRLLLRVLRTLERIDE
jgi:hypothetical protein